MYFKKLCNSLTKLQEVEALALGGSRSTKLNDEKSDYDLYVYVNKIPSEEVRKEILKNTCKHIEMNLTYWEFEDDCILMNDIPIDIIYRNLSDLDNVLKDVVFDHKAGNAYTTCMWNNLLNCRVIFDKDGKLTKLKEKYNIKYPNELKENIVKRNMELLHGKLCSYDEQIIKAIDRKDIVSINHRITAYLETYFNVIFAINELTHPGEKRLLNITLNTCKLLPKDYEINIRKLLDNNNQKDSEVMKIILDSIFINLKDVI